MNPNEIWIVVVQFKGLIKEINAYKDEAMADDYFNGKSRWLVDHGYPSTTKISGIDLKTESFEGGYNISMRRKQIIQ